jgi:putative aldouronate transport system substrate-binding protein
MLLTGTMLTGMLAACAKDSGSEPSPSSSAGASTSTKPAEKPVELTWITFGWAPQPPADWQAINQEINKITSAKLNATVKMEYISFQDYDQKMTTKVAANESFDIAWTSNWMFNYGKNATLGAFLELDELLKKTPGLTKAIPSYFFDGVRVKGKIYGVPNYQAGFTREGLVVDKKLAAKYNLDPKAIKKLEDLEPFLEQVKANEKDYIPFGIRRGNNNFGQLYRYYGMESVANIAAIKVGDDSTKVFNMYETPEYKQYLELVTRWNQKGFFPEDAALEKVLPEREKLGKVAVTQNQVIKPGLEMELSPGRSNQEILAIPLVEPYMGGTPGASTLNAISAKSKNPEKALKLLELVNTDKELYNLICYGIKDKNYTKVNDNTVKLIPNSGYDGGGLNWQYGNTFNAFLKEGQPTTLNEDTAKLNETATKSKLIGFSFNQEPVMSEMANIDGVLKEYLDGLNTASVDINKRLPEFLDKLKKAGSEKVLAELQKQINEWKASNKK